MQEYILGRQPVYEVLRAARRHVYHLLILQSKEEHGQETSKKRLDEILTLCQQGNISIQKVPRTKLDSFGSGHQGVALLAETYPYIDFADILERITEEEGQEQALLLILDMLQDPQNLGTLLRTAEAVGVQGVILPLRRGALVTPAVVHASSGATEHLLICQANLAQSIETLKKREVWVIGLESNAQAIPMQEVNLARPLALVVGNEGQGLRTLVRDSCDMLLRLPMRGKVASLNAATAGSITLYFAWQARHNLV